jgi:hypothetical protein
VTLSFDDEIARRCSAPLQPPAAAASASASVSASATITTSPALILSIKIFTRFSWI